MPFLQLQQRRNVDVWLNLHCALDDEGNFRIEGHDLSPTSEYEWRTVVRNRDVPALLQLFQVTTIDELFALITRDYLPIEGDGLERRIRESDVPSEFSNYIRGD